MYYHYQLQTKPNTLSKLLSFNSILQLNKGISSDLQKWLKYFNGTATVAFFSIPFVPSASVFPNNLDLYSKDLKLLSLAISALKLFASSLEWNHKFLLFQNNLNYILLDYTLAWLNLNLQHQLLLFYQFLWFI